MTNEICEEIAPFHGSGEPETKLSIEAQQYYRPTSSFERTMKFIAHEMLPGFELITGIDVSSHCRLGAQGMAELVRDASNAYKQMPSLMEKCGAKADGESGLNRANLRTLEQMSLTSAEQAAVKFLARNYDELETGRLIDTGDQIGFFSWHPLRSRITMKSLQRNFEAAKPTGGSI